ncbi:hypothetical protein FLT15_17940 [Paenibacillus thiaminolyticus]|uniref:hypothetical protein n=1 Tax=Paenibacillus thiaminolyticus TaxID=49283 RepID=UPI001161E37D|nr:hypothetical protein [Paenibacillus thiaminolyticus]NGP60136.1 hypothetical protein [Paenibacillus thiaminolyticus]
MKQKVDILKAITLQKQLLNVERGEGNEKQTGGVWKNQLSIQATERLEWFIVKCLKRMNETKGESA